VGLDADAWLQRSSEQPGSWWTDWDAWLARHKGPKIRAPKAPGGKGYEVIEPAPGRYVKEKSA